MLKGGLWCISDYSGVECPRECVRIMMQAFAKENLLEGVPIEAHFVRGCDWGGPQQKVLKEVSRKCHDSRTCVLTDLTLRISGAAQRVMASMTAVPSEHDNLRFAQWLMDNRSTAFNTSHSQWCCQHEAECPVYPLQVVRDHLREQQQEVQQGADRPGQREREWQQTDQVHQATLCE